MDYLQLQIDLSNILNKNQWLPEGRKVQSSCCMHAFENGLHRVVFRKPGRACQPVAIHTAALWTLDDSAGGSPTDYLIHASWET